MARVWQGLAVGFAGYWEAALVHPGRLRYNRLQQASGLASRTNFLNHVMFLQKYDAI